MDQTGQAYWSAVLGLLGKILAIWFVVSFGAGILFGILVRAPGVDLHLHCLDFLLRQGHGQD